MSKNLIPQIAEMLGLQLGEEFKVVSKEGNEQICNFTMAGLFEHDNKESGSYNKELLAEIVCNNAEIVKMPWKPKEGESFYTFTAAYGEWSVSLDVWAEEPCNYALLDKGWIYRTEKEAKAALPAVLKELSERRKS